MAENTNKKCNNKEGFFLLSRYTLRTVSKTCVGCYTNVLVGVLGIYLIMYSYSSELAVSIVVDNEIHVRYGTALVLVLVLVLLRVLVVPGTSTVAYVPVMVLVLYWY
jgi:hypothetical protein